MAVFVLSNADELSITAVLDRDILRTGRSVVGLIGGPLSDNGWLRPWKFLLAASS